MSETSRPWIREGLLVCLGLKMLLLFLGWAAVEIRQDKAVRTIAGFFSVWNRWDTAHYFDIAETGYRNPEISTSLTRPPLFPWLIEAGASLTGSVEMGAVLVVTLLSFLPGLLIFRLARLEADDETAFRAMLCLLLFPTAFFIHVVYTEGLFLTLVIGAFLAARTGRWGLVAILGFLAGLTRINAVILAPALFLEAWLVPRGRARAASIAASLAVFAGVLFYLALNQAVAGDPFAFMGIQQRNFYRTFASPAQGFETVLALALRGGGNSMMNGVIQGMCGVLAIAASVAAILRQRPSYAVWMAGNTLMFTAQAFWLSIPRLALVLFPAFLFLAPKLSRPVFGPLWYAGSTLLLGFLAAQFAQGWWVS